MEVLHEDVSPCCRCGMTSMHVDWQQDVLIGKIFFSDLSNRACHLLWYTQRRQGGM